MSVECTTFPYIFDPKANKLSPRLIPREFLGSSYTHKGYKCYGPKQCWLYVSADITFYEFILFIRGSVQSKGEYVSLCDGESHQGISEENIPLPTISDKIEFPTLYQPKILLLPIKDEYNPPHKG